MELTPRQPNPPPPPRQRTTVTRRAVLRIGAMVGLALPLIVTLAPTEAKAQATGS